MIETPVADAVPGQLCKRYAPYTGATAVVPAYWVKRYEREAAKNWELFYRRHRNRFFKDRNYLQEEWSELKPTTSMSGSVPVGRTAGASSGMHEACGDGADEADEAAGEASEEAAEELTTLAGRGADRLVLLEAGCGVGNTIFPLLRAHPALFVYALDFSDTAVEIVRAHPLAGRVTAAVGDLTAGSLPPGLSGCAADVCTLMFVLSAIAPDMFSKAIRAVASGLRDGGVVLLRDYALGDGAQARLEGARDPKRLDASAAWMVRQDGTLAYYFSVDELTVLFDEGGFDTLQCELAHRTTTNHVKGVTLSRRFVTARFRKRSTDT
jgi:methyltransferase-like protein 6